MAPRALLCNSCLTFSDTHEIQHSLGSLVLPLGRGSVGVRDSYS